MNKLLITTLALVLTACNNQQPIQVDESHPTSYQQSNTLDTSDVIVGATAGALAYQMGKNSNNRKNKQYVGNTTKVIIVKPKTRKSVFSKSSSRRK